MERVVFACRLPADRRKSILGQRGGEHLYSPPVRACMPEDSTMRRSAIGLLLALAVLVAPLAATAQPRGHIPVVGMLRPGDTSLDSDPKSGFNAFRQGLRDLGYV